MTPKHIKHPSIIKAAGNKPKIIEEFIGSVNSGDSAISIAKMTSPAGWIEPGQQPDFDEYTIVLKGMLRVTYREGFMDVNAGEAVHVLKGEWVQYSTPGPDGAQYLAVCLPAFSLESVHRDDG
jgi:ethanolamine utilization protein EutQ (cupin superfamily)